jgi:ribosomal protein S15P/S13E
MPWKQPAYLTKSAQSLKQHVHVLGAFNVGKWHAVQLTGVQTRDILQVQKLCTFLKKLNLFTKIFAYKFPFASVFLTSKANYDKGHLEQDMEDQKESRRIVLFL